MYYFLKHIFRVFHFDSCNHKNLIITLLQKTENFYNQIEPMVNQDKEDRIGIFNLKFFIILEILAI